ncbi:MAG: hypothetical protein KGL68_10185 [Burkholderiales bacterium]|nr:hypothetical protein [Burkholderiales bacterium]
MRECRLNGSHIPWSASRPSFQGVDVLPPSTVALPLKVLVFVLVDGWTLVLKALVGSFH